ncbi:MAG: hypothetical protein QM478_04790 [Flavobacteriaceae bacterium]
MKRLLFTLFTFGIILSSCNTNDEIIEGTTEDPIEDNFYALTVGNTWEYKYYKYRSFNDTYDYMGIIDSVKIVAKTEINGNTYFNFRSRISGNNNPGTTLVQPNGEYYRFYRDSLGYLITDSGKIAYTTNDYSERAIIEVTPNITGYARLNESSVVVTTEAGDFDCLDMEIYAKDNVTAEIFPGINHVNYSDGIGLIYNSTSFVNSSNPPAFIHRLDSYLVE